MGPSIAVLPSDGRTYRRSMGSDKTSLPWPRGAPPKFEGKAVNAAAPHWNTGAQVRCAQCGATTTCGHKERHARNQNAKWEDDAEGKDNRPSFFGEPEVWRKQLKEHELGMGDPLPPGERRGWGAYPGHDETVGSPRRHGEWKLVFVPRDKSKDNYAVEMEVSPKRSRSTNPVAHKQIEARKQWEAANIPIALKRDALRSVSMTPGTRPAVLASIVFLASRFRGPLSDFT